FRGHERSMHRYRRNRGLPSSTGKKNDSGLVALLRIAAATGEVAAGASAGAAACCTLENSLPASSSRSEKSSGPPPAKLGRARVWLLIVAPRQRSTTDTRNPTSTPFAESMCARVTA